MISTVHTVHVSTVPYGSCYMEVTIVRKYVYTL